MHEQQNNTVNAKTAVDTASTSGVQRGPGALRAGLVQETFKSDIRIRFGRMDRIELNREGRTFRQQGPRCARCTEEVGHVVCTQEGRARRMLGRLSAPNVEAVAALGA